MAHPLVHTWSATTIGEKLASGAISSVEVTQIFLDRIEEFDGRLGSMITVDAPGALDAARESDARRAQGRPRSVWDGVPITIKDLLATKGLRTTYGSSLYADHVPEHDDFVVERIRRAGLVILGKANTPEIGAAAETFGFVQPRCANPWDLDRTCGGSSGGSGAGLAAGLTPISVGNDSGGSVRLPAALCGIVGLKPSRGLVPAGHEGWTPILDTVGSSGPMTRTIEDAATLLDLMAGPDPRNPQSVIAAGWRTPPAIEPDQTIRAACSWDLGLAGVSREVAPVLDAAVAALEGDNVIVEHTDLDLSDPHPVSALFPLIGMKSLQHFGAAADANRDAVTDYAKAFLDQAATLTGRDHAEALADGQQLEARVDALFADHDLLITQATAVPAWPHGEAPEEIDGEPAADWEGVRYGAWPALGPFNITGHPALIVPCGFTASGLPVGIQLVGPMNSDRNLLEVGRRLERALGVATIAPGFA